MTFPIAEFSRIIRVDQIPAGGLRLELTAAADECRALADRFGLQSIDGLSAAVTVRALAGGLFRVDGSFAAQVVQTCVVSLEPVPAAVEDSFTMTFGLPEPEEPGTEIELSLEDEDPPDPVVEGAIDVGEAVAEHLSLALDPFPRKPGISFDSGEEDAPEVDEKPNPFAVLAQLRKNNG